MDSEFMDREDSLRTVSEGSLMDRLGKTFDAWLEECGLDGNDYLLSAEPVSITKIGGARITRVGITAEELIAGLDFMADALNAIRRKPVKEKKMRLPKIPHSQIHIGYKNVDCKLCAWFGRGPKNKEVV